MSFLIHYSSFIIHHFSFLIHIINNQTYDKDFWKDPKKAELILKELKSQKNWVSKYQTCADAIDEIEVLEEFRKEGEATEEEVATAYTKAVDLLDDLEFRSTLNRPEDELGCILEINSGAGGTESDDWSAMLYRMYLMWGEKSGYKISELHRVDGSVTGLKSAALEIKGDFAYGMLKGENGPF